MTGDIWLHLDWKKGQPISSVYVEILDGHINSITKFKLFLPATRNYMNEIFMTSFFKHLNYLSPRTSVMKVKINDKFYKILGSQESLNLCHP